MEKGIEKQIKNTLYSERLGAQIKNIVIQQQTLTEIAEFSI